VPARFPLLLHHCAPPPLFLIHPHLRARLPVTLILLLATAAKSSQLQRLCCFFGLYPAFGVPWLKRYVKFGQLRQLTAQIASVGVEDLYLPTCNFL
ncbi:hypothetical protein C8J57DRAFT_1198643, partial [Mycena rebaudengoi]